MKFLLLIILIFVVFVPSYSQNTWEMSTRIESIPNKLECPDSNNYFITVQYYEHVQQIQAIYKSINQGKTWNKLSTTKTYNTSSDMSCPDSSNIFLTFKSSDTLFKSTNSGADFIKISTGDGYNESIAMYNNKIGVITYGVIKITNDGWESHKVFFIDSTFKTFFSYSNPVMLNDSTVIVTTGANKKIYVLKLNINTNEYDLNKVDDYPFSTSNLIKINEKLMFICGKSNTIDGGSGHDAIYKSIDGGKNWRRVLDLYSDDSKFDRTDHQPPEFGLQQIAFKDSLTGIAVGQFGKILYTYDGGESWIYESLNLQEFKNPATMKVRYAGSIPIIATIGGRIFRMIEDNLAPGPEDIFTISGRVWDGNKGQPNIPIILGYRVTMTDADGYYKFTRLKKGSYTLKAKNKYYDGGNPFYDYKPFDYTPLEYEIDLSKDTSGFDFNATDLRTYHTISGYVVDKDGKELADIDVRFAHSVITPDGLGLADTITKTDLSGKFEFRNIESYKTWDITAVNEKLKFSPLKHTVRLYKNDTTDLKFVGSPVTSVEDNVIPKSIIVSPNPASEYIEIQVKPSEGFEPSEGYKVQIFNTLGIDVSSAGGGVNEVDGGGFRIDISHLPPGVYFIKIGDRVEKFVKM
jgi:photosystem II stability/assembly factor-like uncharacterized protein